MGTGLLRCLVASVQMPRVRRGISWKLDRSLCAVIFLMVSAEWVASAQTFANSSLSGKYFFVQLLITANSNTGLPSAVSNLGGSITFNGSGSYSYTGNLGANAGTASSAAGNGSYSVSADGTVSLTNPIRSDLSINGRLSADLEVVLGSTTEDTTDVTSDLVVAVKAPSGGMSNASLNGNYAGSTMALPNGTIQFLSSSVFTLAANGGGQFTSASVTGHEADLFDKNFVQIPSNPSYSINADGTGTANFGPSGSASLLNGSKNIFVSADGNYILGFSTGAGARDIFLATKTFGAAASNSSLTGRYWIAELDYDDSQNIVSSGSGAFLASGNQSNLFSERLNGAFSFSSIYYDVVSANSLGQFVPLPESGLVNMGLGVPISSGNSSISKAMVGAQIDLPGYQTTYYGVFFSVLAPSFSGAAGSVFLDPHGVVNGATFAPAPNAIAPGDIVSLFGTGLSPSTDVPSVLPLPTSDQGVSVTVNGVAAPLFSIAPGQINIQIPFQVGGSSPDKFSQSAQIQVTNNGQQSKTVTVPLAPGDPGIFMWADSASSNHAAVLHTNGVLVTPSNPAKRGEIVEVFATGLGVLNPAVATGAGNPSSPPAVSTDKFADVLIDGESVASFSGISFAGGAPGFVGLNQINVLIPFDATTGSSVPIQIASSWGYSNFANIAIQ